MSSSGRNSRPAASFTPRVWNKPDEIRPASTGTATPSSIRLIRSVLHAHQVLIIIVEVRRDAQTPVARGDHHLLLAQRPGHSRRVHSRKPGDHDLGAGIDYLRA